MSKPAPSPAERIERLRDARDVEILGQRRREQAGEPTVTLEHKKESKC